MLTTHYDRTDELPGLRRGARARLARRRPRSRSGPRSTASPTSRGRRDGAAARDDHPARVARTRPAYKERLRDMAERDVANFGLLGYPVLQTVDITIVRGELVPVGEDQVAHLEISREIVRRFNRLYGDVLVEPQPLLSATPLIPGLRRPQDVEVARQRDRGPRRRADEIRAKVRSFVTDPQKVRMGDPGRPEICPVFALHQMFSPDNVDWTEAHCRTGELGCVDCKTNLADHIIEYFRRSASGARSSRRRPGSCERCSPRAPRTVRPVARETLAAVRPRCTSHERARRGRATAGGFAVELPGLRGPVPAARRPDPGAEGRRVRRAGRDGDRAFLALREGGRALEPGGGDLVPRDLRGPAGAEGRAG